MKKTASYKSYMNSPYVSYKHTTYFDSYDYFFDAYRDKDITFVETNYGTFFDIDTVESLNKANRYK